MGRKNLARTRETVYLYNHFRDHYTSKESREKIEEGSFSFIHRGIS
jgi:hypothetical protein